MEEGSTALFRLYLGGMRNGRNTQIVQRGGYDLLYEKSLNTDLSAACGQMESEGKDK